MHNATKLKRDMIEAAKVKEERRRKHSRAGREKPKAERKSASSAAMDCVKIADTKQRLLLWSRSERALCVECMGSLCFTLPVYYYIICIYVLFEGL